MNVHAYRQFCGQVVDALLQLLAELLDVAAIDHGNGQTDRGFTVVMEHRRGRVDVTAANVCNVGQSIKAVIDPQVDRLKVGHAVKLTRGAH